VFFPCLIYLGLSSKDKKVPYSNGRGRAYY
jgi:hypothetical protein